MEKVIQSNVFLGLFIFLGCGLMVFQNLAVPAASSRYDLSCFLILFAVIFFQKDKKELNISVVIFFTIFLILEAFKILYFQYASSARLLSGIIWTGGLFLIFLKKDFIFYNQRLLFLAFMFGFFVTSIWFLKQFIFGMDTGGFSNLVFRPRGFFDEPSYAGLFLYSISVASFSLLLLMRLSLKDSLLFLLVGLTAFILASATLSMHIVTYLLSMVFVLMVSLLISNNILYKFTILFASVSLFLTMAFYLSSQQHFIDRLTFVGSNNLSVVSWLQGLHQALTSLADSPVFGFGLGSTGGFEFISDTHYKLEVWRKVGQNRLDGYSMAYRIVIELGFVFFLFLLFEIFKELLLFIKTVIKFKDSNEKKFYIFNFIFSLTLLLGILIKEPTYTRSYVYVAVLIFFTARIIFNKSLSGTSNA